MNIQGLINNFCELETMILNQNCECICLSETHLIDLDDDSLIEIKDSNIIRVDSSSRHTGGVCIYLKKHWDFKIIKKSVINLDFWWLSIKMYNSKSAIYLTVFYRSPKYLNANW